IDCITEVMSGTILHEGDELFGCACWTVKLLIHLLTQFLDEIDILPLIESSDIVCFSIPSLMKDKVYRFGMINDVQPVPCIFAIAIDGKRLVVQNIVNTKWN